MFINEITGKLGKVFFNERGDYKVANFFIRRGGAYSKKENKYLANNYPIEAWLDDHHVILKKSKLNDVLTVEYIALPREIEVSGGHKRTIIIWKAQKIINWRLKGGVQDNGQELFDRQISMDEAILEIEGEG
jgi:hypothetical protein